MNAISKFYTNPTEKNLNISLYHRYKSFIKDNILKSKEIQKNEKENKTSISLNNNEQFINFNNNLIRINSDKIMNEYNYDLKNIFCANINKNDKNRKQFLSQNNIFSKAKFKANHSKLFFGILNKNFSNNYKERDFNKNPFYNYLNLKNISNTNNSLFLSNKSYFQSIYSDNISYNSGDGLTIIKRKGQGDKDFYNSHSNIYKIEYIKKIIRKYYFDNFDNIKDYYNFIKIDNNNYLTTEDFITFLKNILKIVIDRKELRYLLISNGIIKVDYICFKYIFFPEQTNKKRLNLKLKNEKENSMKIKNNYSYIRRKTKNEFKDNLSIRKKISPFEDDSNLNISIIQKVKLNNKDNDLLNKVNKDFKSLKIENDLDNRNNKIIKKNKYINKIYKMFIKRKYIPKIDESLLKINSIEINNNINKKSLKEIKKDKINICSNNDINRIIINNKKEIKRENEMMVQNNDKKGNINSNENKRKTEITINSSVKVKDKNKFNKEYSIHANDKKNKTIKEDKQSNILFRNNFGVCKNNVEFIINKNINDSKEFKTSIKVDLRKKEKNSDIIEYL